MKGQGGKLFEYDKVIANNDGRKKLSMINEKIIFEDLRKRTLERFRTEPFKSVYQPMQISEFAQKQIDYQEQVASFDPNAHPPTRSSCKTSVQKTSSSKNNRKQSLNKAGVKSSGTSRG